MILLPSGALELEQVQLMDQVIYHTLKQCRFLFIFITYFYLFRVIIGVTCPIWINTGLVVRLN